MEEFDNLRGHHSKLKNVSRPAPTYAEPGLLVPLSALSIEVPGVGGIGAPQTKADTKLPDLIRGRVQRFGDNVDTDSIIPTDKCHSHLTQEQVARGAFCYTRPEFYDRAQSGATILVAEKSFGCGSSREQAPKALMWAGIQAVIARSYAFIYMRNQVNNGLIGIKLQDDEFYRLAQEGEEVVIDIKNRSIHCGGQTWAFRLDRIQEQLLAEGGLIRTYERFGPSLFAKLQSSDARPDRSNGRLDHDVQRQDSTEEKSLDW